MLFAGLAMVRKGGAGANGAEFVGSDACVQCHQSTAKAWRRNPHTRYLLHPKLPKSKSGCEGCHGPGSAHVGDPTVRVLATKKSPPKEISNACLQCHRNAIDAKRWHASTHARERMSCSTCHDVHSAMRPALRRSNPALLRLRKPLQKLAKGGPKERVERGIQFYQYHRTPEGAFASYGLTIADTMGYPTFALWWTNLDEHEQAVDASLEDTGANFYSRYYFKRSCFFIEPSPFAITGSERTDRICTLRWSAPDGKLRLQFQQWRQRVTFG